MLVDPARRQVSQSWGRATAATRAALSGSASRSQRSLVTVSEATGTLPTASAHACGPPSSSMRSSAAGAERVSFHSSASRTTSPPESSATMPCCCPPTEIAATSPRPPAPTIALCSASHQDEGATSVPSGCEARPERTSAPVSASRTTTLQDCVDESIPATRAMSYLQKNPQRPSIGGPRGSLCSDARNECGATSEQVRVRTPDCSDVAGWG